MPDEDGYSLIRKVRALADARATVPALALTAYARGEDRTQALRAGFNMHLAKPIDPGSSWSSWDAGEDRALAVLSARTGSGRARTGSARSRGGSGARNGCVFRDCVTELRCSRRWYTPCSWAAR